MKLDTERRTWGGVWNSCWHSTHMRDRSHFLITHDCGRALNIDACQKTKQSDNIWRNDNGPNKESPVLPYKNEWKSPLPSQSFLYGRTGDSPLTHGAFHQMWSDFIFFRDPSIFRPLPQLWLTRIEPRSLMWVNSTRTGRSPPQEWISISGLISLKDPPGGYSLSHIKKKCTFFKWEYRKDEHVDSSAE